MNAAEAIASLRANQADLQKMGVSHLALFGSTARGEQGRRSDVDLAAQLDTAGPIGLMRLAEIEARLSAILGVTVDLVTEPSSAPRLQAQIDRDRVHVF